LLVSSLLLVFDPADDLIPVKDQSATGPEAEVRKPSGDEGLPYGPRRAADQRGNLPNAKRHAEARAGRPGVARGTPRKWPVFAHTRPWLPRPMPRPALAGGIGQKASKTRGFTRTGQPGLR